MSLRRRVVVAFVLVALVLVATNVLLSRTLRNFLTDRLDRELVSTVSTLVDRRPARGAVECLGIAGNRREALSEYSFACLDPEANVLFRFESPLRTDEPAIDANQVLRHAAPPGTRPDAFTTASQTGRGAWRAVAAQTPGGRILVVGTELDPIEQTLRRFRALQVAATGAVLVALGVLSWWMLRLGVHPIESMAQTAAGIAAGDLARRVDHVDERTEAGRLGAALNTMLERIAGAFHDREASEARVRRFAADASHELRTPLTSIRGYAELWRAGGLRDEAELGEAMRRMEQEADRMAALVDDLLLLARLDQRRPLDARPVRLDLVAADAVRDSQAVEPGRPIELTAEQVTVAGDPHRLQQLVGNLLANARLHTPKGTRVHVDVETRDGRAVLRVADEGPGIPADVAAKVFERFYRGDSARAGGGTGLGLSIVDAIARAHGGAARVESAPGRTVFTVDLPAGDAPNS